MEPNPPLSQIDGRGIVAAKIATQTEFFSFVRTAIGPVIALWYPNYAFEVSLGNQ